LPVEISNATPIPVAVSSTASEQLVRVHDHVTSDLWTSVRPIYTVPAGKRLIIKYLNADGIIDNGKIAVDLEILQTVSPFAFVNYRIPVADQGFFSDNHSLFAGSEEVFMFADSGEVIRWICIPSDINRTGACNVAFFGTLINAP
jgi:hypothetical protein